MTLRKYTRIGSGWGETNSKGFANSRKLLKERAQMNVVLDLVSVKSKNEGVMLTSGFTMHHLKDI